MPIGDERLDSHDLVEAELLGRASRDQTHEPDHPGPKSAWELEKIITRNGPSAGFDTNKAIARRRGQLVEQIGIITQQFRRPAEAEHNSRSEAADHLVKHGTNSHPGKSGVRIVWIRPGQFPVLGEHLGRSESDGFPRQSKEWSSPAICDGTHCREGSRA